MNENRRQEFDLNKEEKEPNGCVFCNIIDGKEPASIITRDDVKGIISFMDLQGYPLVCPIKHIEGNPDELEMNKDILSSMNDLAFDLVPKLYEIYGVKGINVVTNIGSAAGQEIPHIHTHLIPRETGDKRVRLHRLPSLGRESLDILAEQMGQAIVFRKVAVE
jgi:histidine triad (HIT) family protein